MEDDSTARDDLTVTPEELAALIDEGNTLKEGEPMIAARVFRNNLPLAAKTMVNLCQRGSTEKMRFDAAKFIIERVMGKDITVKPLDDPYAELIEQLLDQEKDESKT